jgi:molybdate transport system substrate-binding protein
MLGPARAAGSKRSALRRLIPALFALMLVAAPAVAGELIVFAAASLTNVLQEQAADWQKAGGEKVVFNFAASSALAVQISSGAPADLFFSADEARMDQLEKKKLLVPGSRQTLLSNTLVVVVAADSNLAVQGPQDLVKNVRVLALAEPQTVPAGIYAKEYLRGVGVWAKVIDKVVPTDNVRAALSSVEAGNADAAIVYATDALISKKVKVAWQIPAAEGPKISYPLALIAGSKEEAAARLFAEFLTSEAGKATFRRHGFLVP